MLNAAKYFVVLLDDKGVPAKVVDAGTLKNSSTG
jgi:hypothetical protein